MSTWTLRAGQGRLQVLQRRPDQFLHIDRGGSDFLPARARESQDVVDHLRHLFGALANHGDDALALGIELGGVLFLEDPRKAVHRAQRRAEVVRNRIRKGFEFPVRVCQALVRALQTLVRGQDLGRARGHHFLQMLAVNGRSCSTRLRSVTSRATPQTPAIGSALVAIDAGMAEHVHDLAGDVTDSQGVIADLPHGRTPADSTRTGFVRAR